MGDQGGSRNTSLLSARRLVFFIAYVLDNKTPSMQTHGNHFFKQGDQEQKNQVLSCNMIR